MMSLPRECCRNSQKAAKLGYSGNVLNIEVKAKNVGGVHNTELPKSEHRSWMQSVRSCLEAWFNLGILGSSLT